MKTWDSSVKMRAESIKAFYSPVTSRVQLWKNKGFYLCTCHFLTRKQILRFTDELHQPRTRSHPFETMAKLFLPPTGGPKLAQSSPAASLGSCCWLFPWRTWDEGWSCPRMGSAGQISSVIQVGKLSCW